MKLVIFLSIIPSSVLCFWTKTSATLATTHGQGLEGHAPKQDRYIALNTWNELHTRSYRSDCFRDASLSLHTSCESLEFDSDARVRSAVQMTLCELTTAEHVSVPLECKIIDRNVASNVLSRCVEALGRSAQHWSSYSGYLREIPQLCIAYRRLHEIDHAKSIYENITQDKISLLSALDLHHSKLAIREGELEELAKVLGSIAHTLGQRSNLIEDSFAKLPSLTNELAIQVHSQVLSLLETIASGSQLINQNAVSSLEFHLRSMISEAQTALGSTTRGLSGDMEDLTRSLDSIALSWNSRLVVFNKRLDTMWDETFVRKMVLDHALNDLETRVSDVSIQVNAQILSAEKLEELTSKTSVSIQNANIQIADASHLISHELESLQFVARELQANLTQIPYLAFGSGWVYSLMGPLSSAISGLRTSTWKAQLVMHVVGVGASGIQNSLSLLVTLGCALLFLASQAFRWGSCLLNMCKRWCSGKTKRLSSDKPVGKPTTMTKRRVYRRPLASRSRLSTVLPHFESASL